MIWISPWVCSPTLSVSSLFPPALVPCRSALSLASSAAPESHQSHTLEREKERRRKKNKKTTYAKNHCITDKSYAFHSNQKAIVTLLGLYVTHCTVMCCRVKNGCSYMFLLDDKWAGGRGRWPYYWQYYSNHIIGYYYFPHPLVGRVSFLAKSSAIKTVSLIIWYLFILYDHCAKLDQAHKQRR